MLIGVQKRFFFIANTKAASTAIEYVLLPHSDIYRGGTPPRKHTGIAEAISQYPFLFEQPKFAPESFFRFGVMREPSEWIGSWYRYRVSGKVESQLPADLTFEEFWKQRDWNIVRQDGSHYLQKDMFRTAEGQVRMDMIIPYHQLPTLFPIVCKAFNISQALPRRNVTVRQGTNVIPTELESEVRKHYTQDYELWDKLPEINKRGMAKLEKMTGKKLS